MRFEVRNSGGTLYGTVDIARPADILRGSIRFARARNVRMFGTGLLQLDTEHVDVSFQTIDMKVSRWATAPTIGEHGGYFPGRIDFCLIWDGPHDALYAVRGYMDIP